LAEALARKPSIEMFAEEPRFEDLPVRDPLIV